MTISRPLKICCITTTVLVLILFITLLTLSLTLLKPKQPKVKTQEAILKGFVIRLDLLQVNITLGLVVNVYNPNYASFKYENTTAYMTYRGIFAASAPIEADNIPARGHHNISTDVVVLGNNLASSPYFWIDYATGGWNFTSSATFHGKAKVMGFINIKATTYSTCNITVNVEGIQVTNTSSVCMSKVEL